MSEEISEIKVGRVTFPVCHLADGRVMAWWKEGTKRRRVGAPTIEKLKGKLHQISSNLLSGEFDAAQLQAADHRAYLAARDAVAPYRLSVDAVAREYASAREMLGEVSLLDAVRFYKRHAGIEIIEKSVKLVVLEFLGSLDAQQLSESYRRQCTQDLTRFVEHAGEKLCSEVTTSDVEAFLPKIGRMVRPKVKDGERKPGRPKKGDGLVFTPASGWRLNQVRNTLATMFRFARDRRYLLPERKTQAEFAKRKKVVAEAKLVWSPAVLQRALETTAEHYRDWLPWLAIASFTMMRTGAILRLKWSDFHWESGLVEVAAGKSKVNSRFVVRLGPSLLAWLAPWRGRSGDVCVDKRVEEFTETLRLRCGLPYRKNVLRSSAISYRLAECGNIDIVADEANTSPRKIRTNYREIHAIGGELVTPDLAAKWYAVAPATDPDKVIQPTFKFGSSGA